MVERVEENCELSEGYSKLSEEEIDASFCDGCGGIQVKDIALFCSGSCF